MVDNRQVDTQLEFETLLREALSVEPSANFLPRVRERINAGPERGFWSWRGWLAGSAAAIVCVVAAAFNAANFSDLRPPAPPSPVLWSVPEMVGPVISAAADVPVSTVRQPNPRASHLVRSVASFSDLPVVIVDERQRAALNVVLRLVQEGRLTEEAFKQTTPSSLQPIRNQVLPIGVRPVELNAIGDGGVLQSDK
jgi:hypothetical protein